MTIIEFPKPIQEDLKQENFKRQQQYHTSHALKYDSFEFEDYEIQDTPKKSFFFKTRRFDKQKTKYTSLNSRTSI